jgi:hypothetical protein
MSLKFQIKAVFEFGIAAGPVRNKFFTADLADNHLETQPQGIFGLTSRTDKDFPAKRPETMLGVQTVSIRLIAKVKMIQIGIFVLFE